MYLAVAVKTLNEWARLQKIPAYQWGDGALKQLVNKSATGDLRALRQLVELARDAEAKQNTSGTQSPSIGELDQDVIDGIVKRFEGSEAQMQEAQRANDVDDQRG